MTIINAKKFNNRKELENYIKDLAGLTVEPKDYEISGTTEELKRLFLSSTTVFYGIKCVDTTPKAKDPPSERPQRGEVHDFGLNKKSK